MFFATGNPRGSQAGSKYARMNNIDFDILLQIIMLQNDWTSGLKISIIDELRNNIKRTDE